MARDVSNSSPVEQTVRVLTFIEKTVAMVRTKVEKEQTVPSWLISRINQLALAANMLRPFVQTKKFEPSGVE